MHKFWAIPGLVLLSAALAAAQCTGCTTISDTITDALGNVQSGTITLTWQAFVSPDSRLIPGGSTTTGIVNGRVNVTLEPTFYTIGYSLVGGVPFYQEIWAVPVSGGVLPISSVRYALGTSIQAPLNTDLIAGNGTGGLADAGFPASVVFRKDLSQTLTNPLLSTSTVNFGGATHTIPEVVAGSAPASCQVGELWFNTATHLLNTCTLTGFFTPMYGQVYCTVSVTMSGSGAGTFDFAVNGPNGTPCAIAQITINSGASGTLTLSHIPTHGFIRFNPAGTNTITLSPVGTGFDTSYLSIAVIEWQQFVYDGTTLSGVPASPIGVPAGGTGQTTFSAGLPLVGNGFNSILVGSVTGNTTKFLTGNGSYTNGHGLKIDVNGNVIDSGSPFGGGGSGLLYCAPASASGSAYACTPAGGSGSLAAGQVYVFVPDVTSTSTTPTINITLGGTPQGAKTVQRRDGSALVVGELQSAVPFLVEYNGTVLLKEEPTIVGGANGTITCNWGVSPPTCDTTNQVPTIAGTNTYTGAQDNSGASTTKPDKVLASAPGTCVVGETYYNSTNSHSYRCTATNTWTQIDGSSVLTVVKGHGSTSTSGSETTLATVAMPGMVTDTTCAVHAFFTKTGTAGTWQIILRIGSGPTYVAETTALGATVLRAELMWYVSNTGATSQLHSGYWSQSTASGGNFGVPGFDANNTGQIIVPTSLNLASSWNALLNGISNAGDTIASSTYEVVCTNP